MARRSSSPGYQLRTTLWMRLLWAAIPLLAVFFAACGGGGGGSATPTPEATPEPTSRFANATAAEADDDPRLPGEFVDVASIYGGPYGDPDSFVSRHIEIAADYDGDGNSNPPAGGPHWGSAVCGTEPLDAPPFCGPAPWGIFRDAWPPETLLHNMEHGGLVVWYNTDTQGVIDELKEIVLERVTTGDQLLVMTPYPNMEEEHIAITGWSRVDKFPVEEYTRERVEEFIDTHERRFNPEGF